MTEHILFAPQRIALQKELVHHPDLVQLLQNHPADEFEIRLAEIASYCDIVLNGDYTQQDLDRLCGILVNRLQAKRLLVVIPLGAAVNKEIM